MSRAERKTRWRAKKRAAWQAECAEHGPLWEAVGGKPVTLDDLARAPAGQSPWASHPESPEWNCARWL